MESVPPNLIILTKKKILLFFKMEHSAVAGSGQCRRGDPRGTCRPFSDFCPAPSAPPPASPSALSPQPMNCARRLCLPSVTPDSLAASFPFSALFFRTHRAPRPFAAPPWRRACSFHRLCTCPSLCPEYSSPASWPGSCVLPSDCAQATHAKMPLLFSAQN